MVERHVYLKFTDEFRTPAAIAEVVERTPDMLAEVTQIGRIRIGHPADPRSEVAWDLVLIIELATAADIEPYRTHPAHIAYYHDYLEPRLEVIKAWNFEF